MKNTTTLPRIRAIRRRLQAMLTAFCCMAAITALSSCVDEAEYSNTPKGNFEALWKIINERYCFFDYKQKEYALDWDEVHARYSRQIDDRMTESQLFEVLGNMLAELRDGHVNMYSSFDAARYWRWHEDFPQNFSDSLERRYLGTDYRIAGPMRYRRLSDNTGYIRISSFENAIGEGNLDDALMYLAPCNALIIDIRDNGGGQLTQAEKLAARFTDEKRLVGYMQHKTGKGRADFSPMKEQWLKPSSRLRWHKRVAVLTNRSVYSAANEFVKYMKCCPAAIIIGDKTGGGAGMPFSAELPGGWGVRFSACPMYDKDKQPTEFGIAPDYDVQLTDEDTRRGIDTIIEFARRKLTE